MIYVDTNIFVYSALAHPVYGKACKKIIDDIQDGVLQACCSYLVPIELLGSIARIDSKKAEVAIKAFFSLPIKMIDLDEDLMRSAAGIAGKYNISYDSIHVAAMLSSGVRDVLTEDINHFKRVEEIKMVRPLDYRSSA